VNRRPLYLLLAFTTAGALAGSGLAPATLATSDPRDEGIRTFTQILAVVESRYVKEVPSKDLVYDGIRGMLRTLDPHTNFLDEDAYQEMQEEQRGTFYGLGIVINKRGKDSPLTVIAPIDGTPAARLGIRAGDVISHIRDKVAGVDIDTVGLEVQDAVKYLRGPKGSEVTISIDRPGFDEPLEFTIVRDTVPTHSVTNAWMIGPDTGYIKLINFTQTSADELSRALALLRTAGMKKVILDLRSNPGGLLDQAVRISSLFLEPGQMIVYTKGRIPGSDQEFRSTDSTERVTEPVVVLVNRGSASASEIVSGALQDHDRAFIVGETTFGKGLVQSVYKLARQTGLALTTAHYYTPSGRLIQRDWSSLEDYYYDLEDAPQIPESQRQTSRTDAGRTVFGGGGISPDLTVAAEEVPRAIADLTRTNAFFEYVISLNRTKPILPEGAGGTPEALESFRRSFHTEPEVVDSFRAWLTERKTPVDDGEFELARDKIRTLLTAEMVGVATGGLAYRDRVLLEADPQLQAAIGAFAQAKVLHPDAPARAAAPAAGR